MGEVIDLKTGKPLMPGRQCNTVLLFCKPERDPGFVDKQVPAAAVGIVDTMRCEVALVNDASYILRTWENPRDFQALITSIGGVGRRGLELMDRARNLGNLPVAIFNDCIDASIAAKMSPSTYLLPTEVSQIAPAVTAWLTEVNLA